MFDKARGVYYQKDNRFENVNGKANWCAPCFFNCGDEPKDLPAGLKSSRPAGSPTGWASIDFDSPNYSTDVNLGPGYSLTLGWAPIKGAHWWNGRKYVPAHGCSDKDYRNCPAIGPVLEPYNRTNGQRRSFANGKLVFAPDFANPSFLAGLAGQENALFILNTQGSSATERPIGCILPADRAKPVSITVELKSPYIMTCASGQADKDVKAEISLDAGKTFKPIQLNDFSEEVGGKYQCLVKITFTKELRSLKLEAIVQCNPGSLPYLSPGKNKIAVAVADPRELGSGQLVVTYAYQPGSATSPTKRWPTPVRKSQGPTSLSGTKSRPWCKRSFEPRIFPRPLTSTFRRRPESIRSIRECSSCVEKSSQEVPGRCRCRKAHRPPGPASLTN